MTFNEAILELESMDAQFVHSSPLGPIIEAIKARIAELEAQVKSAGWNGVIQDANRRIAELEAERETWHEYHSTDALLTASHARVAALEAERARFFDLLKEPMNALAAARVRIAEMDAANARLIDERDRLRPALESLIKAADLLTDLEVDFTSDEGLATYNIACESLCVTAISAKKALAAQPEEGK